MPIVFFPNLVGVHSNLLKDICTVVICLHLVFKAFVKQRVHIVEGPKLINTIFTRCMYVWCMFSTPLWAPRDHHVYITMFKLDGLGLADHEHWGMSIKSTQLILDYSETLKRSQLNERSDFGNLVFDAAKFAPATSFSMPQPLHPHVLRDRKWSEMAVWMQGPARIVRYFEHQDIKSYIVCQSDGLSQKEFEHGYQYFSTTASMWKINTFLSDVS